MVSWFCVAASLLYESSLLFSYHRIKCGPGGVRSKGVCFGKHASVFSTFQPKWLCMHCFKEANSFPYMNIWVCVYVCIGSPWNLFVQLMYNNVHYNVQFLKKYFYTINCPEKQLRGSPAKERKDKSSMMLAPMSWLHSNICLPNTQTSFRTQLCLQEIFDTVMRHLESP